MQSAQLNFEIRPGTVNRGEDYEFKVMALLSLRCLLEGPENWWIASNVDGFGAFDDIVLHRGETTYLMQLQHQDNPKRRIKDGEFLESSKGHFSFAKCLQDITVVKDAVESVVEKSDLVEELGKLENIYFVLYTNRDSNEYDFLEEVQHDSLSVLNTGTGVYRCNFGKCVIRALPAGFNLSTTRDCNIYFFPGQVHANDIDNEITKTMEKVLFKGNEIKDVTKRFVDYITNWARGDFSENENFLMKQQDTDNKTRNLCLAKHDVIDKTINFCLTKQQLISKLNELVLCQFKLNLGPKLKAHSLAKDNIWKRLTRDKTIVVVDSDEVVLKFLIENISSEVRRYSQVHENEAWCYDLSDEEKNLFYQRNADLKPQMLQIVGKSGRINLWDIYKCLWLTNRLPLLLEIESLEDFEKIVKILNELSPHHEVILVNKYGARLPLEEIADKKKCFITLQDLDEDHQKEILDEQIKLQGRAGATLANLVDQNMLHLIKSSDVIHILLKDFNVGNELANLPGHYIDRTLSKVLFQSNILNGEKNDIFVIQGTEEQVDVMLGNDVNACRLEEIELENVSEYQTVLTNRNVSWELEQLEQLRKAEKPIHLLVFHDNNCLEWKSSHGSLEKIKRFQSETEFFDSNIEFSNETKIINAASGMGKSTFMDYVASQTPTDYWVLKIDLNKHQQHYRCSDSQSVDTEPFKHLNYFKNCLLTEHSTQLDNAIFERLLIAKKIVVLLDGFDEIAISYKKEVTNIAKCLRNNGFPVWLTTRPIMKTYLEEQFNSFSVTLAPFSQDNQKEFLIKYFSIANKDMVFSKQRLEDFIVQLLKAFKKNINDRDGDFPDVPLQTELLGEAFLDQCRRYLISQNQDEFMENFNLIDLYQKFMDKKIDILCRKYGDGERDNRVLYTEVQCVFAMDILFPLHKNLIGNIIQHLQAYRNRKDELHILQKDGVVTVDENLKITFTHRSFAEYLSAWWLSNNFNSEDVSVKEAAQVLIGMRFNENYRFVFHIFDCIVAKGCSLHLAVINGRVDEAKNLLNSVPTIVDSVDKCERTVLHVLAVYYAQNLLLTNLFNLLEDQIYKLGSECDIFDNTPLDYALGNRSLKIAEAICANSRTPRINVNIPSRLNIYYLEHCASMEYKSLFLFLLPYFISKDLILDDVYKNKLVNSYFKQSFNRFNHLENIDTVKTHVAHFGWARTALRRESGEIFKFMSVLKDLAHKYNEEQRRDRELREFVLTNIGSVRRLRISRGSSSSTRREDGRE